MITLSILFIIAYAYSIYQIRKDCGSWKEFNPYNAGMFADIMFWFGTVAIGIGILFGIMLLVASGIIP